VVERLRRARAAGVTTFDVAGSPEPRQSERLLGEAFPNRDPELVVVVGRRLEDLIEREAARPGTVNLADGVVERLHHTLEESGHRLAPNRVGVVEWTDPAVPPDVERAVGRLGAAAGGPWLCRRRKEGQPAPIGGAQPPARPLLLSGSLSLLDRRPVAVFEAERAEGPVVFLARDPFAGGRLDGTRAAVSGVLRGPGTGPVRLRELQAEFGPVLRLGFLTEHRRRTMAQAAIRYAAHWSWVGSVLAPLPTSDRLEEVLGSFGTPPLSDEEIRRVSLT